METNQSHNPARTSRPRSFRVVTLGCKVNLFDSIALEHALAQHPRFKPAVDQQEAEILLINSCAVTDSAERQARQIANRAKRLNPAQQVVMTGCYAQSAAEQLSDYPAVDQVLGNIEKSAIAQYLLEPTLQRVSRVRAMKHIYSHPIETFGHRSRSFLKVQDGCNTFCTFCVIPSTRGLSTSLDWSTIQEQMKRYIDRGYEEVVLTGIDLGSYGLDLKPRSSLFALLKKIAEFKPPFRIRLSSVDPSDLNRDSIHFIADSECFVPHFHLPIQSADPEILSAMRRPYSAQQVEQVIDVIHNRLPRAGLGTDIICGFPGEQDRQHLNTRTALTSLPFTYAHIFPFSPKRGTRAAQLADRVAPEVSQQRCKELREIAAIKRIQFMQAHIGRSLDLVVEDSIDSTAHTTIKGYSENYVPCRIERSSWQQSKSKKRLLVKGVAIEDDRLLVSPLEAATQGAGDAG